MTERLRAFLFDEGKGLTEVEWAKLREAQQRYRAHLQSCRYCRPAPRLLDGAGKLCARGTDLARVVEVRARPRHLPEPRAPERATS